MQRNINVGNDERRAEIRTGQPLLSPPPCPVIQHQGLLPLQLKRAEVEINRLKERVKILEDKEGVIRDKSVDDAPIKGRSFYEGEAPAKGEAPAERISNDLKEIARVLTSMDAATVLAGEANVPTGSGFIHTAGPPATIISTGSKELEINSLKARIKLLEDKDKGVADQSGDDAPIKGRRLDEGEEEAERVSDDTKEMATILTSMDVAKSTPYTKRKGKKTMIESETLEKKKITRDAEVARIHAEEELQIMIDGLDRNNETVAKCL
nr:hypothetical protein [Tanacetum cinerariifolium]